ncbi:helix-turn-helix domain-containing protein [Streptomyces fulvorobeus]|uniref:Transcriptional regulator n=1 Tax=Streptomyces fulvorobeus TaxID=284028 RepID=A0A7J0CEM6_9ACTN|nr:helix-turn-helix transcriptional regulator [Streptomyces fulvorobeus]NYE43768.1 transcriptional regulator with XRE-family HTH domain [Streptomyces fulvorobeus]GFN00255.1 transcriptional regulator [Streptomyces fulvorobeus]
MVRTPLTPEERARGQRLGRLLREARQDRSMNAVAASAGISAETLRKIETGRAPTPAFFTVAALAGALGLSMDDLLAACAYEPGSGPPARLGPRDGEESPVPLPLTA